MILPYFGKQTERPTSSFNDLNCSIGAKNINGNHVLNVDWSDLHRNRPTLNKNIMLCNFNDCGRLPHPIFPNAENLILYLNDKNFNYYRYDKTQFPSLNNDIISVHPSIEAINCFAHKNITMFTMANFVHRFKNCNNIHIITHEEINALVGAYENSDFFKFQG